MIILCHILVSLLWRHLAVVCLLLFPVDGAKAISPCTPPYKLNFDVYVFILVLYDFLTLFSFVLVYLSLVTIILVFIFFF